MRFISPTLLSVMLITFVLASRPIPAPDKYVHFKAAGCPNTRSVSCRRLPYCNLHRAQGDLFSAAYLNRRDSPKPENLDFNRTDALSPILPTVFTTREIDALSKRTFFTQCGILVCAINREVSNRLTKLIAGARYNVITDYPYNGATGGKISVFSEVNNAGEVRIERMGWAPTGYGGVRFTFQAPEGAAWFQVIFVGDNVASAAVNYYIVAQ